VVSADHPATGMRSAAKNVGVGFLAASDYEDTEGTVHDSTD
jgi:hypothetical protein